MLHEAIIAIRAVRSRGMDPQEITDRFFISLNLSINVEKNGSTSVVSKYRTFGSVLSKSCVSVD